MSITVLNQVYDEARRLAVAGSVVARGDFRLKKLLPPLEQAGAKAPVFAKVAECAKAVIEGPEDASAGNLLELTSLVTAVLYTQGETGLDGTIEPIESKDLGGTTSQTSARLLKPLLEALSSTGSGRLETITEAHDRGAFRDLRLVKPALNGLDDPYSEIADLIAEKILPMYGKAILPELQAQYDPKGAKGNARRLKLMHALDPAATRELVKQALESGSKEVKIAAISCLGDESEDLNYLIEQAAAKNQEVRSAAFEALARIDKAPAVAVLEKAITGKDLDLATRAIHKSQNKSLSDLLTAELNKSVTEFPKLKDKKQISTTATRIIRLISALPAAEHKASGALILDLFQRRKEIAKIKGADHSGSDVIESLIDHMVDGPPTLQTVLARAHEDLEPHHLESAVRAARSALTPAEVFDLFSPYVINAIGKRPSKKDPTAAKCEAVLEALDADYICWYRLRHRENEKLDPRWADLGVKAEHIGLVFVSAQPGHTGVHAFLSKCFQAALTNGKNARDMDDIITTMVLYQHPDATDSLITAYEKLVLKAKSYVYDYWYHGLIPHLPKDAIPKLEAMIPKLKDQQADRWMEAIQELRNKP